MIVIHTALIPAIAVATISLLWGPNLRASTITYTIENATFADGATLTGSFSVDLTTDEATADLTTSPSTQAGTPQETFTSKSAITNFTSSDFDWIFSSADGDVLLLIEFAGNFTGQLTLDGISGSITDVEEGHPHTQDFLLPGFTATAADAVPEPPTAAIVLLGSLGLMCGNQLRKYRRSKHS